MKKVNAALTAAALCCTALPIMPLGITANAAGADALSYPVQEFRIGIGDTNRSLVISGTSSGDYVSSYTGTGARNEKWYLNYISAGTYEIVNSQTGYILTNDGGLAVTAPDTDAANQRWKIESVQTDSEGYDLYYKITANDGSALTFTPESNSVSISDYSGNIYQKYKLNLDGLEGFAANCKVNGKEKAGTNGGLLGETVFADSVDKLISALDSTDPKTVVIAKDMRIIISSRTRHPATI